MGLMSNPPYNLKWDIPIFAEMQSRFILGVPPSSNANYAFILSALNKSDRCVFILPCSVLTTSNNDEEKIKQQLVDKNYIDAVISCPDRMFESTSIPVCILVLDKKKTSTKISFVDMTNNYDTEIRCQNGQFGGKLHTSRTYKKTVNIFNDNQINQILDIIKEKKDITNLSYNATVTEVKNNEYKLTPKQYISCETKAKHRDISDIVNDINRVMQEKGACKLTINETLAKSLGFDLELYKQQIDLTDLNDLLTRINAEKIKIVSYFQPSKCKNEIKFENNSKDILSSVLLMIMNTWKQHIFYLNNEENRYLAELRDALLPLLMNGDIDIEDKVN